MTPLGVKSFATLHVNGLGSADPIQITTDECDNPAGHDQNVGMKRRMTSVRLPSTESHLKGSLSQFLCLFILSITYLLLLLIANNSPGIT